jgi:hypothetical protein
MRVRASSVVSTNHASQPSWRLCKPEVTGSIPVRSIEKVLETGDFLHVPSLNHQTRWGEDGVGPLTTLNRDAVQRIEDTPVGIRKEMTDDA